MAANGEKNMRIRLVIGSLIALASVAPSLGETPLTTAFTYHGQLKEGGVPLEGTADFQFTLWDDAGGGNPPIGGTQVGGVQAINALPVTAGLFTVTLNGGGEFGGNAFNGNARWLQIAVRSPAGGGVFTTLSPRQALTATPHALFALSAATATSATTATTATNATNATNASNATNAAQLGGINASEYVTATSGGTSFIRNQATLQPTSNFNISGNGFIGGNVGIGTGTPATKLDVRGNLTLENGGSPGLFTAASGGEQNRYLTLLNSPTTQTASGLKAGGVLVSDDFGFANPGKNDLIVKGNVGIGTAAPQTKLSVLTTGNGITQTNGTVSVGSYLNTNHGAFGTQTDHPLFFFTGNRPAQMTLDTSGRFGIGTATPAALLTVSGSGIFSATSAARFDLFNTVANKGFLQNVTDTGLWQIATTAGATTMVINPSGNVGIGTIAPNAQLQIAGTGTNGFTLGVEGNVTQNLASGGFAKAMVVVNANGTIARCYNGITGASTGNCGFTGIRLDTGYYVVNFGFQVSDRFAAVTSQADASMVYGPDILGRILEEIAVYTYAPAGNSFDAEFTIIVY